MRVSFISHGLNHSDGGGCNDLITGEYNTTSFIASISAAPFFQSGKPPESAEKRHTLRSFYQNVRGLRTKLDDAYLAVLENDEEVYVLTGTWFDSSVN